jgi:choline dehydrogenase-like flavoprotein
VYSDITVLLLEAGVDDNSLKVSTPLASPLLQGTIHGLLFVVVALLISTILALIHFIHLGTERDWAYKTVPQKHACGAFVGQRSTWPRGKCLGGCSAINYMVYVRGHPVTTTISLSQYTCAWPKD